MPVGASPSPGPGRFRARLNTPFGMVFWFHRKLKAENLLFKYEAGLRFMIPQPRFGCHALPVTVWALQVCAQSVTFVHVSVPEDFV